MKKSIFILLTVLVAIAQEGCYKYTAEPEYATLKGSFVDKFTNTTLDVGNITLSPAFSVNGSMNLDTAGNFQNTKILPGAYSIYGSIRAAFTSDSAQITMEAGQTTTVDLQIEPWISVQQKMVTVMDTTITIQYTIQGNRDMLPARHVISWSVAPKPTVSTYPGGNRNFYTPAAGANNGTFSYTITGLNWNTTYFITTGARIDNAVLNPSNDYNYARQVIVKTPSRP
jgi:hypothetical protein